MMLRLLSVPRPRCDWQVTVAMALVFATMALFLATRDNDFPFAFHPDEESKIVQVQTGDYDFHHPLLMLRAAGLVEALIPVDGTPEQIKQAGRWISALCAAGAVFCLVLIASELGGAIAGLVAGLFLALNHALFELAHYFKEDTAFLFGVSLFLLTLVLYGRAPVKRRAAALGAALGVAASAKYTAVILVPIAVGAVAIAGRRQPWQQLLVGMLSCIGVWLIVNWPLVTQLVSAHEAVLRELHLATGGHAGIGREVPHGYYLWLARVTVNPVAWLLVLVYLLALVPRRREVSGAEWVVAAFPFAFGLMLSFFPQVSYRYFLPGTALLLVLAGLGAGTLTRLCWRDRAILAGQRAWLWGGLVILAGLVAQLPVTIDYYQGFANDTRSRLAAYLQSEAPPDAQIAQDNAVALEHFDLPNRIRGSRFVADLGTLDMLRDWDILYVAVTRRRFGRLFRDRTIIPAKARADFLRRRTFYSRLFAEGELVLELQQGPVKYLQPHLALYRLSAPKSGPLAGDSAKPATGSAQTSARR
jgi:hypothetical protein